MDTAIYEGSGKLCHLEAPLLNKNKAQIVELGLNLGAPYQYTWSCYEGGDSRAANAAPASTGQCL